MRDFKLLILTIFSFTMLACSGNGSEFDASGTFEATEVMVSSEANGKIVSFDLNEGMKVEAGKSYGLIDTIQLHLKKEQLKAAINAAVSRKQDIDKQTGYLREQISNQKKERERVKNLIAANAANTKQLDDINSAIAVMQKQLDATESTLRQNNAVAESEVLSLKTQVEQIVDQLKRCRIVSPINGVVLAKYAQAGELTAIGKPIFKVADISDMHLRAYITAPQLTNIKLGQNVMIYADSDKEGIKIYNGKITWISDKSEFTPKTIQTRDERANLVYAIKISFINDGYVKIGMYGDVEFE